MERSTPVYGRERDFISFPNAYRECPAWGHVPFERDFSVWVS